MSSIPSKLTSNRNSLPWLTTDIKRLIRRKRRVYNKAKAGSESHQKLYKTLENATRDALCRAHWNYVNIILQIGQDSGNNKRFGQYVKAKKQDQSGVAPLRVGGSLYVDAPSKTKIFSEQFSSVFTANTPETADILAEGPSYPPSRISSLGLRVLKNFC